ncbi:MAG: class I SAM-dependent methyltransferase [Nevskiales bacterium]
MAYQYFGAAALATLAFVAQTSVAGLDQALAASHRSAEFVARDAYRHPNSTLEFFGLKPELTVLEVWPAPGYYTEILAPYLRERGRYYAAGFALSQEITPQWRREVQQEFVAKLRAAPQLYDQAVVTELGPGAAWQPAPAGVVDLALTFRNVHNWMKGDYEGEVFAALFKVLKPGCALGVVEHRAKPGTPREKMIDSGYVTEAYVIELAERAGFQLVARSEINANTKDSRNHPAGVWTLPPTLRLGDKDRAKYLAIGESDRMTLKFLKPVYADK